MNNFVTIISKRLAMSMSRSRLLVVIFYHNKVFLKRGIETIPSRTPSERHILPYIVH